jgi:hypothetical protein
MRITEIADKRDDTCLSKSDFKKVMTDTMMELCEELYDWAYWDSDKVKEPTTIEQIKKDLSEEWCNARKVDKQWLCITTCLKDKKDTWVDWNLVLQHVKEMWDEYNDESSADDDDDEHEDCEVCGKTAESDESRGSESQILCNKCYEEDKRGE